MLGQKSWSKCHYEMINGKKVNECFIFTTYLNYWTRATLLIIYLLICRKENIETLLTKNYMFYLGYISLFTELAILLRAHNGIVLSCM